MKLLLPRVVLLLAAFVFVRASESLGEECPAGCSCTEEGTGPFLARCTTLNPEQRFGFKISRLIVQNDRSLVIDKNTFTTVGLQDVSTIRIVNCTFKKLDSAAFATLKELRTLEFETNNQLVLYPDMFNATGLIQLVLRNNKQKFATDSDYLFDVPGLRELEISGAELTQLSSKGFTKMLQLQYVSLSSNKIKSIGKEFTVLPDLEEVDLSNNVIGEISPEVFEKNELDILRLRNNPLTTLEGIKLPELIEIDLSFCKFSKIDRNTFAGLSSLRILNLSGNAVRELEEDSFMNVTSLTNVDLSRNALQDQIPEKLFHPVSGLEVLSLAHNPTIQVLPKDLLRNQRSLFKLDLSSCGLRELDENAFKELESLSILKMEGNLLQRLRPGVLTESITNLDLSNNNINLLDELEFPPTSRIRKLNLAGNKLSEIFTSQLMELEDLEDLDLSSCDLTSFWDTTNKVPKLKNLNKLSIAHNRISEISPQQLALTPKLEYLDIIGNKLVCNDTVVSALKWLSKNKVKSWVHDSHSMPLKISGAEDMGAAPVGWFEVELELCGERYRERMDPVTKSEKTEDNIDDENYVEEDDEEDDDSDDDENTVEGLDNIVQRKVLHGESEDNYWWPVLIVAVSAIAILFSLSILAAFVLRWSRQRNSYGAQMIKHLNTPRKRDGSSIYQQLYEDPNHPTTPIMSLRQANQIRYNFPETSGKQVGYITYLSKDYHDSTVIPESV